MLTNASPTIPMLKPMLAPDQLNSLNKMEIKVKLKKTVPVIIPAFFM